MIYLLAVASLVASASAHSWLACSDYRGSPEHYEEDKCFGWPRNWEASRQGFLTPDPKGYHIGGDSGYNYQPGASGSACQRPFPSPVDNAYSQKYHKAVYEQGSTYCLAWPTKNHVAASCTNQYIPDTAFAVYRSTANPTSDPSQADFKKNPVSDNFGEHGLNQIDCKGFQRSPKFCDNTDKALATGCITLPADLAPGRYVFQWYWEFNSGDSPYLTCWDVEVVAKGKGRGAGGLTMPSGGVKDTLGQGGNTCANSWGSTVPTPVDPPSDGPEDKAPEKPLPDPAHDLTGNSILITKAPSEIPQTGSFEVTVAYSATGPNTITVDLLDRNNAWFGKGVANVNAGTGSVNVKFEFHKTAPKDTGYVLRAWMVSKQVFDDYLIEEAKPEAQRDPVKSQPWTMEMDREDSPVTVGDKTIYPAQDSGASVAQPTSGLLAASAVALLVAALAR